MQKRILIGVILFFAVPLLLAMPGLAQEKNSKQKTFIENLWKSALTYYELSDELFRQNDFEKADKAEKKAKQLFKKIIELTPDNPEAYFYLGMTCSGRYKEKIEAFKQAIKLGKDDHVTYYQLGLAYMLDHQYFLAIDAFNRAIKLKHDYINAYLSLGATYRNIGRNNDAIKVLKHAIQIKPEDAMLHHQIALAYLNIGDMESAKKSYNILLNLDRNLAKQILDKIVE